MAVVAADGKIHAIGGRITSPAEPVALHDVYDPATNTWSAGEPLPTARSGVSGTFYKGLIMGLGGEFPPQDRTFNENEGFDVKTHMCHTLPPLPDGRHASAASSAGSHLYLTHVSLHP